MARVQHGTAARHICRIGTIWRPKTEEIDDVISLMVFNDYIVILTLDVGLIIRMAPFIVMTRSLCICQLEICQVCLFSLPLTS